MTYNAKTKKLEISNEQLDYVSALLIGAIRRVRESFELPLEGFEIEGLLKEPHYIEARLLDIARTLDINLGLADADRTAIGKLDVR
jgi:hypothetical protein